MPSFDKRLTIALWVTLLASLGLSLPYPVFTPLFIDAAPTPLNTWMGLPSGWLYTILIAIYPLGLFIGSSFIGALSDRYGRKLVLAQTLLVCLVGYLVSAWALVIGDFLLLLLSRFFTGITEGNISIARAIALDIGSEGDKQSASKQKVKAMSLINSSMFLGWLLGPLLGGILAEYKPYYAMLAAAVGALFCYAIVQWWLPETSKESKAKDVSVWKAVVKENSLQLLKYPAIFKLFVMYLVFTLAINLYYEFYPVWLVANLNFSSLGIGLATTNMTVFMTLTSLFLVTRVQHYFGLTRPMTHLLFWIGVFVAMIPWSNYLTVHVLFAITGTLIAVFNGLMPVYASDEYSERGNGAVMGLLTTTFCIANVVAALIGGVLLQISSHTPIWMSAALFWVSLLLLMVLVFGKSAKADVPVNAVQDVESS